MITNSMYYNGYKAFQIKQGDGDFVLQPYESKSKYLKVLEKLKINLMTNINF